MATGNLHVIISVDATEFEKAADAAAEAAAKVAWEAFQPEENTIEWYDRHFAENQDIRDRPGQPRSHYYRILLAILDEYKQERADFGDDEAWLSCLRDQYMDTETMTAEFEREGMREKHGNSGHALGNILAGSYDA